MALPADNSTYVLAHRRENTEEKQRLDSQHEVIKHAILDGQLMHPSIHFTELNHNIADLGCGTGIWLNDVAQNYSKSSPAMLIGFDLNPHAFPLKPAPGVQFIEHDCTQPFDVRFSGAFDLVNIRGLAYALPEAAFSQVIKHAVGLLRTICSF